jgi:hypothetical protein
VPTGHNFVRQVAYLGPLTIESQLPRSIPSELCENQSETRHDVRSLACNGEIWSSQFFYVSLCSLGLVSVEPFRTFLQDLG